MAVLILPIGLALGFILGQARLAAIITLIIGALGPVLLVVIGTRDNGISPIEMTILIFGTPVAMWLAKWGAERRRRRHVRPA